MVCRIVTDFCFRRRSSRAALINKNDSVVCWVKETPVGWCRSRTWSAMQKHDRHPVLVTAFFPVETMPFVSTQKTILVGFDGWI